MNLQRRGGKGACDACAPLRSRFRRDRVRPVPDPVLHCTDEVVVAGGGVAAA